MADRDVRAAERAWHRDGGPAGACAYLRRLVRAHDPGTWRS